MINVERWNQFNKEEIKKRVNRVCSDLNGGMEFISLSIVLSLVKVGVFGEICGVCIVWVTEIEFCFSVGILF